MDSGGSTLATVSISNSGKPMGWVYGALGTPVVLTGGNAYYVMSSETSGGDRWINSTPASVASGFTLNSSAYHDGSLHDYQAGSAYGVNFLFGSSQQGLTGYSLSMTDSPTGAKAYVYPNFKYS
jgi:hypothetical protein